MNATAPKDEIRDALRQRPADQPAWTRQPRTRPVTDPAEHERTYRDVDFPYDQGAPNEARADRGEAALLTTDAEGQIDIDCVRNDVTDVLANLMHFADRAGLDFDALIGSAYRTYEGDHEEDGPTLRDPVRFPGA